MYRINTIIGADTDTAIMLDTNTADIVFSKKSSRINNTEMLAKIIYPIKDKVSDPTKQNTTQTVITSITFSIFLSNVRITQPLNKILRIR
jgi:hypothetical protein